MDADSVNEDLSDLTPEALRAMLRLTELQRQQARQQIEQLTVVSEYIKSLIEWRTTREQAPTTTPPPPATESKGVDFTGVSMTRALSAILGAEKPGTWKGVRSLCSQLTALGHPLAAEPDKLRATVYGALHRRVDLFERHPAKRGVFRMKMKKTGGETVEDKS